MGHIEGTVSDSTSQTMGFELGNELRGERATKGKTLLDVQRDLRIQASYIDAIENGDISAFPNPSFISGYVRSYARYLSLVPDEVYARFCRESGFQGRKETAAAKAPAGKATRRIDDTALSFHPKFPLTETKRNPLLDIRASAVGSLLVLMVLVAGLGYGGWMVLQNIQRVQFAPVEDLPLAVAEVEALEAPSGPDALEPQIVELSQPVAASSLSDLYRQQELEVPILTPRDGPIAAIDPDQVLAPTVRPIEELVKVAIEEYTDNDAQEPMVFAEGDAVAVGGARVEGELEKMPPVVTVVAERAAWIRVYLENGTVIFEKILEKGETYTPPEGVGEPLIWAGNAGSVYVRAGDELRGPLGTSTKAVRDVVLMPAAIAENYEVVEDVPEVISQAFPLTRDGAVAIQ